MSHSSTNTVRFFYPTGKDVLVMQDTYVFAVFSTLMALAPLALIEIMLGDTMLISLSIASCFGLCTIIYRYFRKPIETISLTKDRIVYRNMHSGVPFTSTTILISTIAHVKIIKDKEFISRLDYIQILTKSGELLILPHSVFLNKEKVKFFANALHKMIEDNGFSITTGNFYYPHGFHSLLMFETLIISFPILILVVSKDFVFELVSFPVIVLAIILSLALLTIRIVRKPFPLISITKDKIAFQQMYFGFPGKIISINLASLRSYSKYIIKFKHSRTTILEIITKDKKKRRFSSEKFYGHDFERLYIAMQNIEIIN